MCLRLNCLLNRRDLRNVRVSDGHSQPLRCEKPCAGDSQTNPRHSMYVCHICRSVGVVERGSMGRHICQSHGVSGNCEAQMLPKTPHTTAPSKERRGSRPQRQHPQHHSCASCLKAVLEIFSDYLVKPNQRLWTQPTTHSCASHGFDPPNSFAIACLTCEDFIGKGVGSGGLEAAVLGVVGVSCTRCKSWERVPPAVFTCPFYIVRACSSISLLGCFQVVEFISPVM